MKNRARRTRYIMNVLMITILMVLSAIILFFTFTTARDNSLNNMTTIAFDRSQLLDEYISKIEEELQLYAISDEVIDALTEANKLNLSDKNKNQSSNKVLLGVEKADSVVNQNAVSDADDSDTDTDTNTAAVSASDMTNIADPNRADLSIIQDCQEFTKQYSAQIGKEFSASSALEGLYCSTLDTIIVCHSSSSYIGMTTREDLNRREDLITCMKNSYKENKVTGVYNTGVILSPASNQMILSIYRIVYSRNANSTYNDDKPIGLVGMGIYTAGLLESIDINKLDIKGTSKLTYVLMDLVGKHGTDAKTKEEGTITPDNELKELYFYVREGVEPINYDDFRTTKNVGGVEKTETLHMNTDPDVSKTFEKYLGKDAEYFKSLNEKFSDRTGHFSFVCHNTTAKNNQKFISAYYINPDRRWVLLVNSPQDETYAFAKSMTWAVAAFCILCLIIIILFNVISKRQEATTAKLVKTNQKNEKIKANLSSAVMKDILTESNTRISFFSDFQNPVSAEPGNSLYFFMVTVKHLSEINITYGNDVGDYALLNTAETIRNVLPDAKVYRTGSDEFIAYVQKKSINSYDSIIDAANKIRNELSKQKNYQGKIYTSSVALAVIKKSKNVNSSVCLSLKNLLNDSNNDETKALYLDLDNM